MPSVAVSCPPASFVSSSQTQNTDRAARQVRLQGTLDGHFFRLIPGTHYVWYCSSGSHGLSGVDPASHTAGLGTGIRVVLSGNMTAAEVAESTRYAVSVAGLGYTASRTSNTCSITGSGVDYSVCTAGTRFTDRGQYDLLGSRQFDATDNGPVNGIIAQSALSPGISNARIRFLRVGAGSVSPSFRVGVYWAHATSSAASPVDSTLLYDFGRLTETVTAGYSYIFPSGTLPSLPSSGIIWLVARDNGSNGNMRAKGTGITSAEEITFTNNAFFQTTTTGLDPNTSFSNMFTLTGGNATGYYLDMALGWDAAPFPGAGDYQFRWGTQRSGSGDGALSTEINNMIVMGQMAPRINGLRILSASIAIGDNHTGQFRVGAYLGGQSATNPASATLLVDFGLTTGSAVNQYHHFSASSHHFVPSGTNTWFAFKNNDSNVSIAYTFGAGDNSYNPRDWGDTEYETGPAGNMSVDESVAFDATFVPAGSDTQPGNNPRLYFTFYVDGFSFSQGGDDAPVSGTITPVIRTKTIEYVFTTLTSTLSASTRHNFASRSIYIPEIASRSFKSVFVQVAGRGTETAATSITSWLIGVGLTTASYSDVTITDTIPNSGEQQSFLFIRDLTSYFVSNFGNQTEQSCSLGFTLGAIPCINLSAKLFITYDYLDDSTIQIKTVKIPIQSETGMLTSSLGIFGTDGRPLAQVPNLHTFCPESNKVFRNIWFEMMGFESTSAVTDYQLGVRLDSDAEQLRGTLECGLNSSPWLYDIWNTDTMTTGSTHTFSARTTTTSRISNFGAVLHATYEYNHATSTYVNNSIILPFSRDINGIVPSPAVSASRETISVNIQEGDPMLQQSGLCVFYNAGATTLLSMSVENHPGRRYTATQGSLNCGQMSIVHRIDPFLTESQPAITLSRGLNEIDVNYFTTAANLATSFDGYMILNYTSSKHSLGDGAHNHSTYWFLLPTAADAISYITSPFGFNIAENNYFVNSVGFCVVGMATLGPTATTGGSFFLQTQVLPTELPGAGWDAIGAKLAISDGEASLNHYFYEQTNIFGKYPNDPKFGNYVNTLNIKSNRCYKLDTSLPFWCGIYGILTYHGISYIISGSITNYSGTGAGINVYAFTENNQYILSMSSGVGGAFTGTYYDNSENVFCVARQSSTLMGRSDDGTAF